MQLLLDKRHNWSKYLDFDSAQSDTRLSLKQNPVTLSGLEGQFDTLQIFQLIGDISELGAFRIPGRDIDRALTPVKLAGKIC